MGQNNWLEVLGWNKAEIDDLRFVAHSYIKQGIYDVALTFFDAIQVLTPPTAYDLQTIGALYLQLGNAAKALHFLDRALALQPLHLPTELNRAKALFMLGQKTQALEVAQKIAQSDVAELAAQASALILSQQG